MNIFTLDKFISSILLGDKHVVKMCVEYAQIASTALRLMVDAGPPYLNDYNFPREHFDKLYKATHKHHPCVLWASHSELNLNYVIRMGITTCNEYTLRYDKQHKSFEVLQACRAVLNYLTNRNSVLLEAPYRYVVCVPEKYLPEERDDDCPIIHNICSYKDPSKVLYKTAKLKDAVRIYQAYYLNEKAHLMASKNPLTSELWMGIICPIDTTV